MSDNSNSQNDFPTIVWGHKLIDSVTGITEAIEFDTRTPSEEQEFWEDIELHGCEFTAHDESRKYVAVEKLPEEIQEELIDDE